MPDFLDLRKTGRACRDHSQDESSRRPHRPDVIGIFSLIPKMYQPGSTVLPSQRSFRRFYGEDVNVGIGYLGVEGSAPQDRSMGTPRHRVFLGLPSPDHPSRAWIETSDARAGRLVDPMLRQ